MSRPVPTAGKVLQVDLPRSEGRRWDGGLPQIRNINESYDLKSQQVAALVKTYEALGGGYDRTVPDGSGDGG